MDLSIGTGIRGMQRELNDILGESRVARRIRKYRLTLLFTLTAVVVMATAAVIVNQVLGALVGSNLARISEEHASQDALHIESMINGLHSTFGAANPPAASNPAGPDHPRRWAPLDLESLTGPNGLPSQAHLLTEERNVVNLSLFDLSGMTVWSTDPGSAGRPGQNMPRIREAIYSGVNSQIQLDEEFPDSVGLPRRADVIQTYLPLRELPSGHVVGVLGIKQQVARDITIQVEHARSSAFWTMIAAMSCLFLLLVGFVAVADVALYRSRRRELASIERSNQRLESSNRELQHFASIAAHDLQEPLRKVQVFGQRLDAKFGDALTDQGRDYLSRMLDATGRMTGLIDDLLSFSRVTTKTEPFSRVDLYQVVQEVISDLEVRIEQVGGRVEVDDLPTIYADPTQMRQLFQNLIGNALKFHREDQLPVVKVKHIHAQYADNGLRGPHRAGEVCQIAVEDNGIGFDEKYLDRLFTIFQRLHGRGEYEGNGVGLAVCRKIADRHGGSIMAESVQGQGAKFTVTLPVQQSGGETEQ